MSKLTEAQIKKQMYEAGIMVMMPYIPPLSFQILKIALQ